MHLSTFMININDKLSHIHFRFRNLLFTIIYYLLSYNLLISSTIYYQLLYCTMIYLTILICRGELGTKHNVQLFIVYGLYVGTLFKFSGLLIFVCKPIRKISSNGFIWKPIGSSCRKFQYLQRKETYSCNLKLQKFSIEQMKKKKNCNWYL